MSSPVQVFLIQANETETYCGMGSNFRPEVFSSQPKATDRLLRLQKGLRPHCGIFYTLDVIDVDVEQEDY